MSGSSAAATLLPVPTAGFHERKAKILLQLAVPDADYSDASPKGSVDEGIRPLMGHVNAAEGFVTTSSCAGRVSVFVEGRKAAAAAAAAAAAGGDSDASGGERLAGVGGKGGGGTWLYVSHDSNPKVGLDGVNWVEELGLSGSSDASRNGASQGARGQRLIHFKFEPMILHVLTASHAHAQLLLRCALHAGFRESGAVSLTPSGDQSQSATPMVAVRSMGLGFESLIGYAEDDGDAKCLMVPPEYLDVLMRIGNERFVENAKRIARFELAFSEAIRGPLPKKNPEGGDWEDPVARRERMKAEGLRRQAALKAQRDVEAEAEATAAEETELAES